MKAIKLIGLLEVLIGIRVPTTVAIDLTLLICSIEQLFGESMKSIGAFVLTVFRQLWS